MNIPMFRVPASPSFVQYLAVVNSITIIPQFEHKYLGTHLVTKDSLASKVEVDENKFRLMSSTQLEGRQFYYDFVENAWFVLQDSARIA